MDRLHAVLAGLLLAEGIVDLPKGEGKREVVARLGRLACGAAGVDPGHEKAVLDALWEREQILSTGIGIDIAVPHVRHSNVGREVLRVGRSKDGIPFDAIDGRPVRAVFCILMPAGNHRRHVEVLGAIAASLKDPVRREAVLSAPDAASFVARVFAP